MADDETPEKNTATANTTPQKPASRKRASRKPTGQETGSRADGQHQAGEVARLAAAQLQELTGNEVEGITGVRRVDDGWVVELDVLELRRIPSTTDVLATYEVEMDRSSELVGYRRRHRFVRGNVGEDR